MSGAEVQAGSELAAGGPEPGKLHCYLFSKQNVKVNCCLKKQHVKILIITGLVIIQSTMS